MSSGGHIISVNGHTPQLGENNFVAESAYIIGDVITDEGCSIWFGAILRGDVNKIRIGKNVNVQDGAIVHCTYQQTTVQVANNVSIAHRAVVHGCHIHSNVLIGMGAIVMDNAIVHSNCIIAAGAVVTENTILESGWVYAGTPAKKLRPLTHATSQTYIERIARNYKTYAAWYQKEQKEE